MLVALGFLLAALAVLLFLPLYRGRVERLATQRLKRSLPVTEGEVRAERDKLSATYALQIHNREAKLETAALTAARQTVEINRRDARISDLETRMAIQQSEIAELENARRVLIQTITDRLPKVETRLAEARKILFQRDREIADLATSRDKQLAALDEARQVNLQQSGEMARLKAALETRQARNRDASADPKFDAEIALRTEIEELRGKIGNKDKAITALEERVAAAERVGARNSKADSQREAELEVLKATLADAQEALTIAQSSDRSRDNAMMPLERKLADQEAEIARLKGQLQHSQDRGTIGLTPADASAMKARVATLEAEVASHIATIRNLQAELTQAQEQSAQQAVQLREEIRKLTPIASPDAAPVTQQPTRRKSLRERINAPRLPRVETLAESIGNAVASNSSRDASAASPSAAAPAGPTRATPAAVEKAVVPPREANSETKSAPHRPRLLDRISAVNKPAG